MNCDISTLTLASTDFILSSTKIFRAPQLPMLGVSERKFAQYVFLLRVSVQCLKEPMFGNLL